LIKYKYPSHHHSNSPVIKDKHGVAVTAKIDTHWEEGDVKHYFKPPQSTANRLKTM
jgi:hypothetical protein